MARSALVEGVQVVGHRLTIRPGPAVRSLLLADPWVEVAPAVDLASVPGSVLLQTAVYLLAPLAWAHGLDTWVSGADETVAVALPQLQAEMRRMYPTLPWAGSVVVRDPVSPAATPTRTDGDPSVGLMFSGGVDSLASALRYPDSSLLLITAALDDEVGPPGRWADTLSAIDRFANEHGHRWELVASNARSMVAPGSTKQLRPVIRHWWSQAAHAMSLAALAAPVLWRAGVEQLLIASSDVAGHDSRWGSSARLDPLIGLGPITIAHDTGDPDRLRKVRRIVESVGSDGTLPLRVCYHRTSDGRLNCGVCEKCLRTQAGLIVCGGDPARFGFPDAAACALALSPDAWAAQVGGATRGTIIHWAMIGEAARAIDLRTRPPETRAFLGWLATLEVRRPPLGDPTAMPEVRAHRPGDDHRMDGRPRAWRSRLRRWLRPR
jgi:hypothetical protein